MLCGLKLYVSLRTLIDKDINFIHVNVGGCVYNFKLPATLCFYFVGLIKLLIPIWLIIMLWNYGFENHLTHELMIGFFFVFNTFITLDKTFSNYFYLISLYHNIFISSPHFSQTLLHVPFLNNQTIIIPCG